MRKVIISAAPFVFLILLGIIMCGCGSSSSSNVIPPIVTLSISPTRVSLSEGETQQFTATVTGTSQTAVAWSVTGCTGAACGTITSTGFYTAPFDIPVKATVTVVATLSSDAKRSGAATVDHVPHNLTRGEAQGVYSGTSYYGVSGPFYTVVLPNDMYYAFYQDFFGDADLSMMVGQGESVSGTFTAELDNFFVDSLVPVRLTAKYVPGVSMTGSIEVIANGATRAFDATALPSSQFEWDTPANLGHVTGTWGPITIASDGTFTGTYSGCSVSGTITPDSSNKNFFNLTITFGGVSCSSNMANQTASGIVIETLLSDLTTRQILVAAPVAGWRFLVCDQR